MEKEFDFLNDKALCVINDTEPCVIKYNGETIRKLSAIKSTEQGTTEVTYNSEYKKNLLNMAFEGNTIQPTTTGKNLIDPEKLAELIISYKGVYTGKIIELEGRRCVQFYNGTLHGKDFTSCCPAFKEKTRYIFSFEAKPYSLLSPDAQNNGELSIGFKPSGIYTPNKLSAKDTTKFTRIYNINNSNTTVTDINISYGSVHYWLIDLDSVYLYEYDGNDNPPYEEYTGRIPSPNVEYPQPIENSTNVSAELRGVNRLISPSDFSYRLNDNYINYDISTQIYDINFVNSGTSQSICHFDTPIPTGTKYTLLAEVLNDDFEIIEGNGTFALGLYKKDDTGVAWAGSTLNLRGLATNKVIIQTNTTREPTTDIWLFRNMSTTNYVKNLKVRFLVYFGNETITEWQPYFPPTKVDIPLTLRGIGDRKDNLSIDYINKKAIVKRNVFASDLLYLEWSLVTSSNNNTYFQADINKNFSSIGGYCNRCKVIQGNATNENLADGEFKVYFNGDVITLVFASNFDLKKDTNSKLGDLNKLNQWLTNNPTNIALALLFNDTEEYKEEQWVKDLLALPTQNATNIINISADVPVSKLNVDYAIWGGRENENN